MGSINIFENIFIIDKSCQFDIVSLHQHTDDSYVTLDGDEGYMLNHSHVPVIALFPIRLKVSDKLRKMLEHGLVLIKT